MISIRCLNVFIVSVCALLGAATTFAAATLDVSVIGGSGSVTVVVTGPDGVAQTTDNNEYEFQVPVEGDAGVYEIAITVGGVSESTEVTLPARGAVNVVFIVEPGPPRIEATSVAVESITVTARRIEETLQEVPLSVTAVSGVALKDAGIDAVDRYLSRVPNTVVVNVDDSMSAISMRGVASIHRRAATVATYVDDTPVTGSIGQQITMRSFDIERVEALRGPQGTLYGEGSMSGTVKTVLNKPSPTGFAGAVELEGGSLDGGGNLGGANLMLNLPVVEDKFALRLVGLYRRNDGWIDMPDLVDGPEENTNSSEVKHLRLSGRWFATDRLIVDAVVAYGDTQIDGLNESNEDGQLVGALNKSPSSDEAMLGTLTFTYAFDWATLISATSYWDRNQTGIIDGSSPANLGQNDYLIFLAQMFGILPPVPVPPSENSWFETTDDTQRMTQEFRLSSTGAGPLSWTGGLFFKSDESVFSQEVYNVPDTTEFFGTGFVAEVSDDFEQLALFGELNYRFSDAFEAAVGARVFREERTTHAVRQGWFWDLVGALSGTDVSEASDSETFNEFLPKLSLKWNLGTDAMVFALAAKGFRSGGINLFPSTDPTLPLAYDPDYVWNYELGTKTGWFGNRMTLNGAVYYLDWENVQDVAFSAVPTVGFLTNVGAAHTTGLELEINARPTQGFTIGAAAGWIIEAETDEDSPFDDAPAGTPLANVPEYNRNLFLQYRFPLGSRLSGMVNGNYEMVGESTQFFGSPYVNPAYEVLSFNFSFEHEKFGITLFIDNATNEYIQIRNLENDRPGHGLVMRPRTIGLRFSTGF